MLATTMPTSCALLLGHHGPGVMPRRVTNCTPTCTRTSGFDAMKCAIRFITAMHKRVIAIVVVSIVTNVIDNTNRWRKVMTTKQNYLPRVCNMIV